MKTLLRAITIAARVDTDMRLLLKRVRLASPLRLLATTVRHVRRRGLRLQVEHEGLPCLAGIHLKAANRVSVALVTLGLYLAAASLLMQRSLGPMAGAVPVLAMLGYAAVIWYTARLIRAVGRGL